MLDLRKKISMSELDFYLRIFIISLISVASFIFPSPFFYSFCLVMSLLTLISALGPWNVFFELLSNFHPQLLIVSLLLLIISFLTGYFRLAILFAMCAFVHVYALKDSIGFPYSTTQTEVQARETSFLRVMTLDMQESKTEIKKLKDRISDEKPMVIVLSALPKDNISLIDGLKSEYPYTVLEGGEPPFNAALLSKWPIQNSHIERVTQSIKDEQHVVVPILTAKLCTPENNQRCLTALALLTPNVLCEPAYLLQQKILRKASQIILGSEKNPVIVMGDLHMTPWTFTFKVFLKNAHLRNSAIGFP